MIKVQTKDGNGNTVEIPLTLEHGLIYQSNLIFLSRNGSPVNCPFNTRMLVPANDPKQPNNKIQGFRKDIVTCGSHCPHFGINVLPSKDEPDGKPQQVVCTLSCGNGRVYEINQQAIKHIPRSDVESPSMKVEK